MLVRIKLQDSTTANLIASIKTIVLGNLTASGSAPTNLTGVDNSNSIIYGSVYQNSNNLYSNPQDDDIVKVHYTQSGKSSFLGFSEDGDYVRLKEIGDPSAPNVQNANISWGGLANLSASYFDVIVTDRHFAINQIVGAEMFLAVDMVHTSLTSRFANTHMTAYEYTSAGQSHNLVQLLNVYKPSDDDYVDISRTGEISSLSGDIIPTFTDTVIPLSSVVVGNQSSGMYPVYGLKGFANVPLFSGGGLLNDGSGNYYYTTGKRGYFGTTDTTSLLGDNSLGTQIAIEVQ